MSATIKIVKLPKDFHLNIEDIEEEFREEIKNIEELNQSLQEILLENGSMERGDNYFEAIFLSIPRKYVVKTIDMGAWEDAVINITEEDIEKIKEIGKIA